jgi:hypothetical protein
MFIFSRKRDKKMFFKQNQETRTLRTLVVSRVVVVVVSSSSSFSNAISVGPGGEAGSSVWVAVEAVASVLLKVALSSSFFLGACCRIEEEDFTIIGRGRTTCASGDLWRTISSPMGEHLGDPPKFAGLIVVVGGGGGE